MKQSRRSSKQKCRSDPPNASKKLQRPWGSPQDSLIAQKTQMIEAKTQCGSRYGLGSRDGRYQRDESDGGALQTSRIHSCHPLPLLLNTTRREAIPVKTVQSWGWFDSNHWALSSHVIHKQPSKTWTSHLRRNTREQDQHIPEHFA